MAPKAHSVPRPATSAAGKAPRALQVAAAVPPPVAAQVMPVKSAFSGDAEADTAHAVPPDFKGALEQMIAKREAEGLALVPPPPPAVLAAVQAPAPVLAPAPAPYVPPPAPLQLVPPAPPSTPPERMPARAAMISGVSFSPVARSSIAPVTTSLSTPSPSFDPLAVASTIVAPPSQPAPPVAYMPTPPAAYAPVPPPPQAPVMLAPEAPTSYAPPPPSSRPVAYERAFQRWSRPSFDVVPEDVPSTEPLTFQVYTPDALPAPSRPRLPTVASFEPPPKKGSLALRVVAVVMGIAAMVGVGVAGLAAASDDAPSARAASAPLPATTIAPPTVETAAPAPAAVPAPTVVVAPAAPSAPTVAAAEPVKPAAKKPAAKKKPAGAPKGDLPPNPYGG